MSPWLLFVAVPILLGLAAQRRVDTTFSRFSGVPNGAGLAGCDVAHRILSANGLEGHVHVMSSVGELTDHYDPRERVVHLSEPVFQERSVAAAAVAAHEVGHALQHASASRSFLLRSRLWPLASYASNTWFVLLLLGALLGALGLVGVALVLFGAVVVFQLVTLPVELDASRRARRQLAELELLPTPVEAAGADRVLRAAAFTYVAAALASALLLLYYLGVFRHG